MKQDIHKAQTCTTGTSCVRPVQAGCLPLWMSFFNTIKNLMVIHKKGENFPSGGGGSCDHLQVFLPIRNLTWIQFFSTQVDF